MPIELLQIGIPTVVINGAAFATTTTGTIFATPHRCPRGTWSTAFSGGNPSSAGIVLQASLDQVVWTGIDTATNTLGEERQFVSMPSPFIRWIVTTAAGGSLYTVTVCFKDAL